MSTYTLTRRTHYLRGKTPLSGFALDLSIRMNGEGAFFLEDRNSNGNSMPMGEGPEFLLQILTEEIWRHYNEFMEKEA